MSVIELLDNPKSKITPAITLFNGITYTAWTDDGDDNKIYLSWSTEEGPVASYIQDRSRKGPSLASADGKIFIGWNSLNDHDLYVTYTANGTSFSKKKLNETTPYTPALVNFKSEIYAAFTGDSKTVYVKGVASGKRVKVGSDGVGGPSTAVYNGTLYVAWPQKDSSCAYVTSTDGVNFTSPQVIKGLSTLTPALAATSEQVYLVWTSDNQSIHINSLDGRYSETIESAASAAAPAAMGLGTELFVLWAQPDRDLAFFSLGSGPLQNGRKESRATAGDYVTAERLYWGFRIDLSTQAVSDVENGLSIISSVSGALADGAGAGAEQVSLIGGIVAGVAGAGNAILGFLDRGNGVSIYVPWTALIPVLPPLGPGGVVVPVPR